MEIVICTPSFIRIFCFCTNHKARNRWKRFTDLQIHTSQKNWHIESNPNFQKPTPINYCHSKFQVWVILSLKLCQKLSAHDHIWVFILTDILFAVVDVVDHYWHLRQLFVVYTYINASSEEDVTINCATCKYQICTGCSEKTERLELLKNIMLIYVTVKQ